MSSTLDPTSAAAASPAIVPTSASYSPRQWLSIALGLLVSLIAMTYVATRIEWTAVGQLWSRLTWWSVALMVAVYLSSYALRGWRWQLMLAPVQQVSWRTSSAIVLIGYMANNLLPFRMGEVVRGLMLSRRERVSSIVALSSIGVERVLDALTLIGCLAITSAIMQADQPASLWSGSALWLLGGFLSIVCGVLAAVIVPQPFRWLVQCCLRPLPSIVGAKILTLVDRVMDSLQFIRWNRAFAIVLLSSLGIWAIEGTVFWIGLRALGMEADWVFALFCLAVVNLTILIPSAPGYVGVFQIGAMFAFSTQGWAADDAAAYAILVHLCQFLPVTLGGLLVLNGMGASLRSLPQQPSSRTSEVR